MKDEAPDPRIWPQLFCGTLVAFPYLVVVLIDYYVPGVDEAFQLEAAVRLAAGQGYTASWWIPRDLAIPTFGYLVEWPLGYSALVSGLLGMGVPLALAAKLIKLTAILTALTTWIRFANRFLPHAAVRVLFCGFLGFYVVVCAGSISDLLIFALFPVFSQRMLAWGSHAALPDAATSNPFALLSAGVLAGLAVVLKYSALPFVLLGSIWIACVNLRQPRRIVPGLSLFGFPAVGIIGTIFLSNYLHAGSISTITESGGITMRLPGWREWTLDSWRAAFFDAPYVPMLAVREWSAQFGSRHEDAAAGAALVAILAAVVASVFVLVRRGREERTLAAWLIGAYVSAVLYLGLTTSLYFPASGWTPLTEGRYYRWLVPGMVLCLLAAAGHRCGRGHDSSPRIRTILQGTVLAGFFAASTGYSIYVHRVANVFRADTQATYETVYSIVSALGTPTLAVFLDIENFRTFPRNDHTNVFVGNAVRSTNIYFSRQTVIAMVCTRSARLRSGGGENYCLTEGFDSVAAQYGFNRVEIGARNTLYWRVFAPGAA